MTKQDAEKLLVRLNSVGVEGDVVFSGPEYAVIYADPDEMYKPRIAWEQYQVPERLLERGVKLEVLPEAKSIHTDHRHSRRMAEASLRALSRVGIEARAWQCLGSDDYVVSIGYGVYGPEGCLVLSLSASLAEQGVR